MVIKDKDRNIATVTITEELYSYYQYVIGSLVQISRYEGDNEDALKLKEIADKTFERYDNE